MEKITSKSNRKVLEAMEAKEGKGETFLVEGYHLVEMALEAGEVVFIMSEKPYEGAAVSYLVSEDIIRKIAFSKNPEGILAVCKKKTSDESFGDRVLVLDGVADPGNVGTLIRSALAFGFLDVVFSHNAASAYSPRAISASQGAIFKVRLHKGDEELVSSLKKEGYTIMATSLQSSVPLESHKPSFPLVLILGNEARGVSSSFLSISDQALRITMSQEIDSLNVAMAGSIIMHDWRK